MNFRRMWFTTGCRLAPLLLAMIFIPFPALAKTIQQPVHQVIWRPLGGRSWQNWSGIKRIGTAGAGIVEPTGTAAFSAPATPGHKGWYKQGFLLKCGGTINFLQWYGLECQVKPPTSGTMRMLVKLSIPPQLGRESLIARAQAMATLSGTGWHTVILPWSAFNLPRAAPITLHFIRNIRLAFQTADGKPLAGVLIRHIGLRLGLAIRLKSPVRSRAVPAGSNATYHLTVINCTHQSQGVQLQVRQSGWHAMRAAIWPAYLVIPSGDSAAATVTVKVPAGIPPGGFESQIVTAVPNGDAAKTATLKLFTVRHLPAPNIMFTRQEWNTIRAEIKAYPWARKRAEWYARQAKRWKVPVAAYGQHFRPDHNTTPLFGAYAGVPALRAAIAWQLTRNKTYAAKAGLFLRRLSDPKTGYPATLMACNASFVQEGQSFQSYARAYDLIKHAGVLTPADREQIHQTLRLWMHVDSEGLTHGDVSNWSIAKLCGGAYSAMALEDMAELRRFLYGPGGFTDQIRAGEMSDGWWFEGAVTYDFWCASEFTKLGLACRPWGINILTTQFPVRYSPVVGLHPYETSSLLGMSFEKSGQLDSNHVSIQRMWKGFLIYPDYRGVIFGLNDAHEMRAAGSFALAYDAFGNPAFAAVAKKALHPHLLYSVPVLPAHTPQVDRQSGYSDNAAVLMLRSYVPDKPAKDMIQAVLRYGTHGGYHGHFDLGDLVSVMRFGQSFYNPETSWYGYGSAMYKLWVQSSLSHNMVVVDDKMQLPGPSSRILFFNGKLMQAGGVQAICKWANPPYGGGIFPRAFDGQHAPYYPKAIHPPAFGAITGKTGPILQRRLLIVVPQFIIVADYLKAAHAHTFDDLLQLRGARLASAGVTNTSHSATLNADPLGSGQFITNCRHYTVNAPFRIASHIQFAPLGKNGMNEDGPHSPHPEWETGGQNSLYNTPGTLHMDEYGVWPLHPRVIIGDYPEAWSVNKPLAFSVRSHGKVLAAGHFNAWILGSARVNVNVRGLKSLTLRTHTASRGSGYWKRLRTIFWGNPVIVLANGTRVPLSKLKFTSSNIIPTSGPGIDYLGGPVQIAGNRINAAIAAEPENTTMPGVIRIDLAGLHAVAFEATVGGDWPVGKQDQLRKTCVIRTRGNSARFITVIEPYHKRAIVSAMAMNPHEIQITLTHHRRDTIVFHHLAGNGRNIGVTIQEARRGKIVASESTVQ